jgi:ferritin-like metal-binding protein YciE
MADAGTLHDAFIDELRDTYDAEKQLTKALTKLAKASSNPKLRQAFESHLEETQGQIERLERVFESLDEKVRGKHCDGIAGIIEEGKSIMEEDFDETTMDACLIAAGQRAEHYEMAAYGTLVAWAQAMGHTEAAKLLQQTLDEEKAADKKLSGLAESGINQSAADAHPDEEQEPVGRGPARAGRVRPLQDRGAARGRARRASGPRLTAIRRRDDVVMLEVVTAGRGGEMNKPFAIVTGASSGIGLELAAICA